MSAQSIAAGMIAFRFRILVLLLVLLTTPTFESAGQDRIPGRACPRP
jgi:hypothetical protein